jgi:peptidoglycan/LPS O-acetylase OafA/YrhL
LAVIGFHAFPAALRGGFTGVDIFFVISGYLISQQLLNWIEEEKFSFWAFYARRIRRIFPALVIVLLACLSFGWFALFANEYAQLAKHIAASAVFLPNFVLLQESGYFDTAAHTKPLLHLWSLGVEEQFYLLWPAILLLIFKLRWNIPRLIGVMLLASLLFSVYYTDHDSSIAFYLPISRFWELMLGSMLSSAALIPFTTTSRLRTTLSIAGIALILSSVLLVKSGPAFPGYLALLPAGGTFLMISAGPDAWINRFVLASPVLVGIGLISYPLYLWHWPLLSFAAIVNGGIASPTLRISMIAASVVLAFLTYVLVERPIRHRGASAAAVALAIALALTGGIGLLTFERNGFEFRPPNKVAKFAADLVIPGPTIVSDGSCAQDGIEQIKNEVCLMTSRHPDTVIIGDSHAMSLNSAPFMNKISAKTLLIAAYDCPPFISYVAYGPAENKARKICADVARQAFRSIVEHPEITRVLIAVRGPLYLAGGFGSEQTDPTLQNWRIESITGDVSGEPAQMFALGFSEIISRLETLKKTVVFVIDVPELGFDPHLCLPDRPFALLRRAPSDCTIPRSVVDQRQADYRKAIGILKAAHPGLLLFDSIPVFCDQAQCYAKGSDHIYYYDSNHLNVEGSAKVWQALLPVIARSPMH